MDVRKGDRVRVCEGRHAGVVGVVEFTRSWGISVLPDGSEGQSVTVSRHQALERLVQPRGRPRKYGSHQAHAMTGAERQAELQQRRRDIEHRAEELLRAVHDAAQRGVAVYFNAAEVIGSSGSVAGRLREVTRQVKACVEYVPSPAMGKDWKL